MRCVVQRVDEACVTVDHEIVGSIGKGLAVLVGVERGDGEEDVARIADKLVGLRIFSDEEGKMNLGLTDIDGELLLISQFTLLGDARKGKRPSFARAESGEEADRLFEELVSRCSSVLSRVETGAFGAHMKVSLVNDGPVTILLDSKRLF